MNESLFQSMLQSADVLMQSGGFVQGVIIALVSASRTVMFPALVSIMLVRLSIGLSHKYEVLARPSDRGSHTVPTPRLGGVGSAAAFYITMLMMMVWRLPQPLEAWRLVVIVGGAWALIGGALDDFLELPPRWKLLLQLAACGTVLTFGFAPDTLTLPFGTVKLGGFSAAVVAVITTLFLMNIFNFMDGMDGQASVFGIITGSTLGLYLAIQGFQNFGSGIWLTGILLAMVALAAVGTLIGVLLFNYPGRDVKMKTFLGDGGSQFYGFILAVMALQAGQGPPVQRFPWIASLILFSPFIYDVAYTLVRRIRRGEKLTQAHRTHLYQRLMVAGWSHGQTLAFNTILYIVAAILAWGYARCDTLGMRQVAILMLMASFLGAYTLFVIEVERRNDKPARPTN